MKRINLFLIVLIFLSSFTLKAQVSERAKEIASKIEKEANENSQLENLAHELLDVVGPCLVGTPQMEKANDWAIARYKEWGKWRGWERGITHVDLVSPRVVSLSGMQLA